MAIRAKQAGDLLGVSSATIRNWCNNGELEYTISASGQRIFDERKLKEFYNKKLNKNEPKQIKWYYARSSDGNDTLIETQLAKLVSHYGEADKIFKDKASGLNENRKGLNQLIKELKKNDHPNINIYITNKDRLTRFGYKYLEELFTAYNAQIIVLDSDKTKEPLEILMQDFMSLITSFSGKFYRLRGYSQQKALLEKASNKIEEAESNGRKNTNSQNQEAT